MLTRPRIFVLTDISSLTAGVREPDDGQSLIRLLVHSSQFEIEGLVASSGMRHGPICRPELIREAIDAYGAVLPSLRRHEPGFPDAERLRSLVGAGNPVAGPEVPPEKCIGKAFESEGAERLIAAGDKPDDRPLWVLLWGGATDLAQALWKVAATRSPAEAARFRSRLRVHAISDQDAACAWIKETYPDLCYITHQLGMRGMYRGGDLSLVGSEWVEKNIRVGHGPLGALYPNYEGGDIWSGKLGRVRGVKEGDTPSFLRLFPNGLSVEKDPTLGSWGGIFRTAGPAHRYINTTDGHPEQDRDPAPEMAAVYRWRSAYQNEFAARMDWCVRSPEEANHPPLVRIAGEIHRTARPGDILELDAYTTEDPDKDRLTFAWTLYPPVEGVSLMDCLTAPDEPITRVKVPDCPGATLPVLLTVTDSGLPPLARYGRVLVRVV